MQPPCGFQPEHVRGQLLCPEPWPDGLVPDELIDDPPARELVPPHGERIAEEAEHTTLPDPLVVDHDSPELLRAAAAHRPLAGRDAGGVDGAAHE